MLIKQDVRTVKIKPRSIWGFLSDISEQEKEKKDNVSKSYEFHMVSKHR